jgi:hypothetical protein
VAKVKWRGQTFDDRTADMLTELARISGKIYINPTQGSYSGAAASAGTHTGGGAADLMHPSWSKADYDTVTKLARKIGFAAWHRTPAQANWPRHLHLIAVQKGGKNDKGVLSSAAHKQVKAYFDGKNGLASGKPDDATRYYVGQTWEKYKAAQKPPTSGGGGSVTGTWYKSSGVPSGTLQLPVGEWVELDARIPGPPRNGQEDRYVHLTVVPTWQLPPDDPMHSWQTASLRLRWVRLTSEGRAPTSLAQSFTLTPWDTSFAITFGLWEPGRKDLSGFWEMLLLGATTGAEVRTRYTRGRML